ncbi:hypothetical protein Scep_015532 [Stephania cephalantha]|uniref:Fatty acyl-CoA reductase n=1 Tax=Stephania cephalantha TaxID=152367 RepID=A0AAP0P401_9MAGN
MVAAGDRRCSHPKVLVSRGTTSASDAPKNLLSILYRSSTLDSAFPSSSTEHWKERKGKQKNGGGGGGGGKKRDEGRDEGRRRDEKRRWTFGLMGDGEKVLRVQPEVQRLFLLIRAADSQTAMQRLRDEVIGKELFKTLREMHGTGFEAFLSERIIPVAGSIACENLGIADSKTREEMLREITVIVNLAATTNFYARLIN